jgi:hypothetical protein
MFTAWCHMANWCNRLVEVWPWPPLSSSFTEAVTTITVRELFCLRACTLSWIHVFLAYFPYFEKIKEGLWDHHSVCVSLYPPDPINFWMPKSVVKLDTYIMSPEPISVVYFINPSNQSVCICIPLSLLGNGWVKPLLWQWKHSQQ